MSLSKEQIKRLDCLGNLSEDEDGEACVRMAIMRRGLDEDFYAEVPAGKYADGDTWKGRD